LAGWQVRDQGGAGGGGDHRRHDRHEPGRERVSPVELEACEHQIRDQDRARQAGERAQGPEDLVDGERGNVAELVELSRAQGSMDLRLSASHTIGEFLLPGWLADFRREHPGVHPQLEIVNSQGVVDAIRENRCEIGFIEGLDSPVGLEPMTLARDEIAVVVAADHPWAGRRAVAARDLVAEPYLTREPASGTRAVATAALARGRRAEPLTSGCQRPEPQTRARRRWIHIDLAADDRGRRARRRARRPASARRRPPARAARDPATPPRTQRGGTRALALACRSHWLIACGRHARSGAGLPFTLADRLSRACLKML
jgi:hypothetical protein